MKRPTKGSWRYMASFFQIQQWNSSKPCVVVKKPHHCSERHPSSKLASGKHTKKRWKITIFNGYINELSMAMFKFANCNSLPEGTNRNHQPLEKKTVFAKLHGKSLSLRTRGCRVKNMERFFRALPDTEFFQSYPLVSMFTQRTGKSPSLVGKSTISMVQILTVA